jgi:hypothetical protein
MGESSPYLEKKTKKRLSVRLPAAMARTLSGANRQKLFASFSRKRRPSRLICL